MMLGSDNGPLMISRYQNPLQQPNKAVSIDLKHPRASIEGTGEVLKGTRSLQIMETR